MRIKANMIRFWKKKKAWEFSQEVLEEGEEILYENPLKYNLGKGEVNGCFG